MEWKKGFLTAPPERKPKARKATALPDEAFLPAESYDIMDDSLFGWLLMQSTSGRAVGAHSGTPCSTWSRGST